MHGPTSSSPDWQVLFEIQDGFPALLMKSPNIQVIRSTARLENNKWIYLGVSYDASTREVKFFQNGLLLGTKTDIPAGIEINEWKNLAFIHLAYSDNGHQGKTPRASIEFMDKAFHETGNNEVYIQYLKAKTFLKDFYRNKCSFSGDLGNGGSGGSALG